MTDLYSLNETPRFLNMPTEERVTYFGRVARKALAYWDCDEETEIKLLNYTENATYEVKPKDGRHFVMRIHRALYTTENSIKSEFDWLDSLRKDGICVPAPIETKDHKYIVRIDMPEDGDFRYVDCCKFEDGKAPLDVPQIAMFEKLGEIIGVVHNNSQRYVKPEYYERIVWDADKTFQKINNYHFEVYRENPVFTEEDLKILDDAQKKIRRKLDDYGKTPDKYGVIHSDFRFSNILLKDEDFVILDFDDFGDGWYMFDVASVLALNEDRENAGEIMSSIIRGYEKVRKMSDEDKAMLSTFQMFRRFGMISVGMFFTKAVVLGAGENVENNEDFWNHYYKATVKAAEKYLEEE